MKVSEVIEKLEYILKYYGDVECIDNNVKPINCVHVEGGEDEYLRPYVKARIFYAEHYEEVLKRPLKKFR